MKKENFTVDKPVNDNGIPRTIEFRSIANEAEPSRPNLSLVGKVIELRSVATNPTPDPEPPDLVA